MRLRGLIPLPGGFSLRGENRCFNIGKLGKRNRQDFTFPLASGLRCLNTFPCGKGLPTNARAHLPCPCYFAWKSNCRRIPVRGRPTLHRKDSAVAWVDPLSPNHGDGPMPSRPLLANLSSILNLRQSRGLEEHE